MTIGELAERVRVNPRTIRYYEDIGLLPPPHRRPSGYREYGEEDVGRLTFVRTAQGLGLALGEIAEILRLQDEGEQPCEYVLGVLDRQVDDLDRRMDEMQRLRSHLVALRSRAGELVPEHACYCAVIEQSGAVLGT